MAVEWVAMGSNAFNAFVPFYTNVGRTPEYFANTAATVSTESFYWTNRLIGALADAHHAVCRTHIERYQNRVSGRGHALLGRFDSELPAEDGSAFLERANDEIGAMAREETEDVLGKVLYEASLKMKNGFNREDG